MIFWNIKLLKQRLIDEGLSQKHLFIYIFYLVMILDGIGLGMLYLSYESFNKYEHATFMAHFIIVGLGTYNI